MFRIGLAVVLMVMAIATYSLTGVVVKTVDTSEFPTRKAMCLYLFGHEDAYRREVINYKMYVAKKPEDKVSLGTPAWATAPLMSAARDACLEPK